MRFLRSDRLQGVTHGFFTRQGGRSGGIFDSLNCALASSDSLEAVTENRAAVAKAMGVAADRLLTLRQIHGAKVVTLRTEEDARSARHHPADAFASRLPGYAVGILTADCAPVLLADREAGVIGAAHSGWWGVYRGVVSETVKAMERLGARRSAIRAAVGPCIAQASYEVDAAFRQRFLALDPAYAAFFADAPHGKARFDLKGAVGWQLKQMDIRSLELLPDDTYADEGRFFSFRRTTHRGERDYGRQISVIAL